MVKKKLKITDEHRNMSEVKLTKDYLKTLKGVYQQEGILAATAYELKSFFYSLWRGIEHFADRHTHQLDWEGHPYPRDSAGRRDYNQAQYNLKSREHEGARAAYLLRNQQKEETSPLARTVAATPMIVGIFGGLFFLSSNVTGNVIADLTNSTSNIIGACLLVLGIVGAAFFFKK